MIKKFKWVSLISIGLVGVGISLFLFLLLTGFFGAKNHSVDPANLPIEYLHGDFAIDVDNPYEVVGAADYYFIATVNDYVETEYRDLVTMETAIGGTKQVGSPYTLYNITVLENIKGNLMSDTPIPIVKYGGVRQDGKSIEIFENDSLLQIGETYIISAFAQRDGSLLISGPNSNELLPQNKAIDYTKYQKYHENEVLPEYYHKLPRSRSDYEKPANDRPGNAVSN